MINGFRLPWGSKPSQVPPTPAPPVISGPTNPRPSFTTANVRPGEVLMPPGRPHDADRAEKFQDGLLALRLLHNKNDSEMVRAGMPPPFPTAERPPTEKETRVLQAFANRMQSHQQPFPGGSTGFQHNVDKGEFSGTYHTAHDADGRLHVREHSFQYTNGVSVPFRDEPPQPASVYPNYPRPSMYVHSHPTNPTLDSLLQRPATANTMPSNGDLNLASGKYASHGADNYLIWGDKVVHYNGKDFSATELTPSPLLNRLPPAPQPLHPVYPPYSIAHDQPIGPPLGTAGAASP